MATFKALVALLAVVQLASALNNGLGKTPQMGWNSWNQFGCDIDEQLIRDTADLMVDGGFKDAGYVYLNLDDCWQLSRDANGVIQPDPKTFPSGMKALSDYVRSKGLLFGLYSDAGFKTCAGRPGSLGYEEIDAKTYAEWDVSYLKYDNCNTDGTSPKKRYPPMRDALNATGKKIFFSMCEWGVEDPATWSKEVGNSWRTTGDISANWKSWTGILDQNDKWAKYAAPGGWNDPDMLEVGVGQLTLEESVAHFSLWSLIKAPLIMGADLRNMKPEIKNIYLNKEVIAVNQDALGVQGKKLKSSWGGLEVWGGPVSDGHAVVLFNRSDKQANITVDFSLLSADLQTVHVRDLWQHKELGNFTKAFTAPVVSHGAVMVKITPA
eukprot:Colp12_sorted_trinity150504_noHs@26217